MKELIKNWLGINSLGPDLFKLQELSTKVTKDIDRAYATADLRLSSRVQYAVKECLEGDRWSECEVLTIKPELLKLIVKEINEYHVKSKER